MEIFETDTVVIGAGVIGLAIARALALSGREPLILEKNTAFGEETSARNSEVIHAGIYYNAGSLKAQHCVTGRRMLYEFCEARGVPYRRCGKLIVATDEAEAESLEAINRRAGQNGVEDLRPVSQGELGRIVPDLRAVAALESPSTGIIDSHAYMLALLGEAEANGAMLSLGSPVICGGLREDGGMELEIGGETPMLLRARSVINAAGLWSTRVSSRIEGLSGVPELALVKGSYFSLQGRAPFSQLIYPVPRDGGLGVHLTLDMAGRAKFGPDTEWLESNDPAGIDYQVSADRRAAFEEAIRHYWPGLPENALVPDYSGVRPKIRGEAYPDFHIGQHGPGQHVFLYGMESPGLTASLAIAAQVARLLAENASGA